MNYKAIQARASAGEASGFRRSAPDRGTGGQAPRTAWTSAKAADTCS